MTRHGKRGTDGDRGEDEWLAGDHGRQRPRADARGEYSAAAWENVSRGGSLSGIGTSSDPNLPRWDQTAPPWELPGWDDPGPPPGRGDDLTGGHPSAPLPRVTGPLSAPGAPPAAWPDSPPSSSGPMPRVSSSGPMPAVPGDPLAPGPDWGAGGYPGRFLPAAGDSHSGFPREDDPYAGRGGYGDGEGYRSRHGQEGYPPGPYAPGEYPDAGQQPGPGYPGPGPGYSGAGYPPRGRRRAADPPGGTDGYPGEDGYPTDAGYSQGPYPPAQDGGGYPGPAPYYDTDEYQAGPYPGGAGYPDEGGYPGGQDYGQQAGYAGGAYPDESGYPEYPAGPGYPGGDYPPGDDGYPGYQGPPDPAGGPPHGGPEPGYTGHGDWYGDMADEQPWADEGYADGFVPGLGDEEDAGPARPGPAARGPAPRPAGPRRRGGAQRGRGGKRKSGLRRAAPWIAAGVLFFVLCTAGAGYYYVWRTYLHPPDYSGAGQGWTEVQVKSGDTATAVGQLLFQKGVVASARAFANAAKASGRGTALEPGTFRMHLHMKASLAFAMLLSPASRVEVKVTIPEGLRLSNIIAVLGQRTGDLAGYKAAIKETSKLGLPPYANGNPQGYLYPDTYSIQHGTPPLKVLQDMVATFGLEAKNVNLPAEAAKGNLTPAEVITVASLLEAEGGQIKDYPKIAEVIYNRLNMHMKLQLDSTVLFALHKYGILATNAQLKVNSPYNTYQHFGLPPGPIDSPGNAAITAALHPAHGGLLYFVTVDPKHRITKFTSSPTVFLQLKKELMNYLAHNK